MNERQRKQQQIKEQNLTQALVREWLDYNPETGWLTWKVGTNRWKNKRAGTRRVGRRAGGRRTYPYRSVQLGWVCYPEHRIIWLHAHGKLPKYPNVIDHVNGKPDDNRLANLREATRAQNVFNTRRRIGIRNVWQTETGWTARLNFNFKTRAEACEYAFRAMRRLHGDFIRAEDYGAPPAIEFFSEDEYEDLKFHGAVDGLTREALLAFQQRWGRLRLTLGNNYRRS